MRYMKGLYVGKDDTMERGEPYHLNVSLIKEPDLNEKREFITKIVGYTVHFIKYGETNYTGSIDYRSKEAMDKDWIKFHGGSMVD